MLTKLVRDLNRTGSIHCLLCRRKATFLIDLPQTDPQISKVREREMVTKTEETELYQLENQVENGGGGVWEYLCLVRKLKVRRSEIVLKHGLSILNDPGKRSALGPDGLLILTYWVFL